MKWDSHYSLHPAHFKIPVHCSVLPACTNTSVSWYDACLTASCNKAYRHCRNDSCPYPLAYWGLLTDELTRRELEIATKNHWIKTRSLQVKTSQRAEATKRPNRYASLNRLRLYQTLWKSNTQKYRQVSNWWSVPGVCSFYSTDCN